MKQAQNNAEIAQRFGLVARRYCSVVDSAPRMERAEFLLEIYRLLPCLVDEATKLPDVEYDDDVESDERSARPRVRLTEQQSTNLYHLLKEKLGDWDSYRKVFDPTSNEEAIPGSIADDVADIYRDLKEGSVLSERHQASPENVIFLWRFLFYSHWGKHAIDALEVLHCRLSESLT